MTIRVLRIITRLNVGGPAKQVLCLQNELPKNLISQHLITGNVGAEEVEVDLKSYGKLTQLHSLRRGINPIRDVVVIWQMSRIIKDFQPDVIHTHLSKAWLLAIFARRVSKYQSRSVHTFHGHILHSYFSSPTNSVLLKLQKFAASKSDVLISVGERVKKELLDAGIGTEDKFLVISPGILESTPRVVQKKNVSDGPLRMLFVGRLEPIKQPEFLLKICEELKFKNIPHQLTIVGDGRLMGKLREMDRKKGLNTRFVGMQSNLDLYYESSDILLICSANEGTPLVTIEASRYSVPTLSSAVGSMEDLIKNHENGFLVENTLNAFVSKLIELNDNRGEMVRVGTNCEKSFKESFRKDIFLDKHVDCYLA